MDSFPGLSSFQKSPEYFGCDKGEVALVLVSLELDAYGYEMGWKIQDENGFVFTQVLEGDHSIDQSYSTVSKVISLPRDLDFNFVLSDSYGDGFNGQVVLYLGDEANTNKILGYCDERLDGGFNYFSTIYSFAFQTGEDGIIPIVFTTEVPFSPSAAPSVPTVSPAPTSPVYRSCWR